MYFDDITGGGVRAQIAIFVPRHELGHEIKRVIERNLAALGRPGTVPILRGRDHGAEDGQAPCLRWREARALGHKGLPVYSNLCRRSQEQEVAQCPHFNDCDYIRAWQAAYASPFVILVHSYLGIAWEGAGIVHGVGAWEPEDETAGEENGCAAPGRRFNPTHAAIIVCDEDPTQSLVERWSLKRKALRAITEGDLGELILAGLDTSDGLLSYLHDKGVTPERLRAAAGVRRLDEWKQGQVTSPSTASADVGKAAADAAPLVRLSCAPHHPGLGGPPGTRSPVPAGENSTAWRLVAIAEWKRDTAKPRRRGAEGAPAVAARAAGRAPPVPDRERRADDPGGFPQDARADRRGKPSWLPGTPAHAAARGRIQAGEPGRRHAGPSALPRSPQHSAHRPIHRARCRPLQGLLAGLSRGDGHQEPEDFRPAPTIGGARGRRTGSVAAGRIRTSRSVGSGNATLAGITAEMRAEAPQAGG